MGSSGNAGSCSLFFYSMYDREIQTTKSLPTICLKKTMGANYIINIFYVNFQTLISIKTSSSVENSKMALLSEGYFYVKFCNLISSKCREVAGVFFKGNAFALFGFVLQDKVASFPPSFTNHFHHLCLKMPKPFCRYELLYQFFLKTNC